jgi:hypothetical protein
MLVMVSSPFVSTPLCPAGHLPRKGGDWLRRRWRQISPLAGEMSGRTEGGAKKNNSPDRRSRQ